MPPPATIFLPRHFSKICLQRVLASAIVHLGHSLHLKVVAEGVETDSQVRFLKRHRCDEVQGFFYSEPMTPEALVLHFIDDLDSKLNQLRAARDATPGIVYHRGLARYVYLPAVEPRDDCAPVERLSSTTTSWPSASSRSVK